MTSHRPPPSLFAYFFLTLLVATPASAAAPEAFMSPAPAAPPADVSKWCSGECNRIICLLPSVAAVSCWSCCFETCMCRGGQGRCGEAVDACAPDLTRKCPNMIKEAPTPPK